MIQRIQSLWLFLAAMISGLLLLPSMVLYKWALPAAPSLTVPVPQLHTLSAANYYPLLVIAAFMTVLPLIAIFFFMNRQRQRQLASLSIIASAAFAVMLFIKIANINSSNPGISAQEYGVLGALLPVVSIVFLILAVRGIRSDEKLIRSVDRLR